MAGFRTLTDAERNRCPWCYQDMRQGTHGEQETTEEGVMIRCSFHLPTLMPAYSTRIIAIPGGEK